ncbi:MAG TPA: ATP-binding protein [Burkholderiales bacterium]|nr:ATP-binding protein [Burkholderiales bacterium]
MKLLPRSLFGRIALILVGGLVGVQLFTTAIHISERDDLVFRNGASRAAARIGDVVRVLDAVTPAQRPRIMHAIADATLKLTDDKPAGAEPSASVEETELFGAAREALALVLDPGTEFRVIDAQPVNLNPESWYAREFMERAGMRIHAAVLLRDGTWIVAESTSPPRPTTWFTRLVRNLAIVDGVMLVLLFFAVRLVTRPMSVLARAAEELGRDIERPPLPETGTVELARASRALNTMQDRLKRYVETRLEALGAMSHDLKTPITRMRLRAEMLEDAELKTRFTRDLDAMQNMVGSTLDHMRGLSDGGEELCPIDLNALISSLKQDAEEAGHAVTVAGETPGPVMGRAQALKRCLQNLLDNALAYGQRADITVREEGRTVNVAIADGGPGIPERDIERVFEPFYRVEGSRNRNSGGSGLGLSIARNIAQAHGGAVRLRNLPHGGLEATLVLPRGA